MFFDVAMFPDLSNDLENKTTKSYKESNLRPPYILSSG